MQITLLNRFLDDTAFISDSRGLLLVHLIYGPLDETRMAEHPHVTQLRTTLKPKMTLKDGIAHIPVQGVLAYNPDPYEMLYAGIEDSRSVLAMVSSAAEDSNVKGMLLDMDSPGGFSNGGFEIADAVAEAQKVKPVISHIGGTGASLGYLIASQAGTVIANRSARVGSIGAYNMNIDRSRLAKNAGIEVEVFKNKEAKFKAMGLPGTSLSDEQKTHLKAQAQSSFDDFSAMVLAARPNVSTDAMQGQVFSGQQAKANGLVDYVGDYSLATKTLKFQIDKRT